MFPGVAWGCSNGAAKEIQMASKIYASPAEAFDDSTPYRESVRVQIKGLRQVGEDTF